MPLKTLELSDYETTEGANTLHCPACGGSNICQGRVDIFNRKEDAPDGTHVSVNGDSVLANRDLAGNPSSRRHGLTIKFRCEECPADIRMRIYQHKGNTFVGMEYEEQG